MCRTTDLVPRLQTARRERMPRSLDRFHLPILDDFTCLSRDEAETPVLSARIAVRCEQRSLMITATRPFGAWDRLFPDETTVAAAGDRRCHKAVIPEMNAGSYRRKDTRQRQRKAGRPAQYATAKDTSTDWRARKPRWRTTASGQPSHNPLAIAANLRQGKRVTASHGFSS